jgi:hypothetical protein
MCLYDLNTLLLRCLHQQLTKSASKFSNCSIPASFNLCTGRSLGFTLAGVLIPLLSLEGASFIPNFIRGKKYLRILPLLKLVLMYSFFFPKIVKSCLIIVQIGQFVENLISV